MSLKRIFKRNTHNNFFRALGNFGITMNRFYENRNHDIYSNGELRIIKKLSDLSPSVIIDGGANIGRYSLEVDKHCSNVSVYSFEPVESTFSILENNTKDTGQIIPVMKGLYSENTKKEINIFPGISHSSIYDLKAVPFEKVDSQTIELISGDQFMAENDIDSVDLLKLDVEGAEYSALEGFKNAFHNKRIKMVLLPRLWHRLIFLNINNNNHK